MYETKARKGLLKTLSFPYGNIHQRDSFEFQKVPIGNIPLTTYQHIPGHKSSKPPSYRFYLPSVSVGIFSKHETCSLLIPVPFPREEYGIDD